MITADAYITADSALASADGLLLGVVQVTPTTAVLTLSTHIGDSFWFSRTGSGWVAQPRNVEWITYKKPVKWWVA